MLDVRSLFDLEHTLAKPWLESVEHPWDVIPNIGQIVMSIGQGLPADEYEQRYRSVWVHRSASVSETACLAGPCVIGPRAEVRHCAFVRGGVLIGSDCVVGNSTELKNCILFDCCEVPHFNYVGDSVLGPGSVVGRRSIVYPLSFVRGVVGEDCIWKSPGVVAKRFDS